MLLPLAAFAALLAIRRGSGLRPAWLVVVAASAALTVSSWVAVRTGQAEEETAESVVSEAAIHEHEEAAEAFTVATGVLLLLTLAGLAAGRVGNWTRPAAAAATLVILGLGYRVGHAGGELVYTHGAAQAYAEGTARSTAALDARSGGHRDDDHDGRGTERERGEDRP